MLRVEPAAGAGEHEDDNRTYSLATTNAYHLKMFDFPSAEIYDIGVSVKTNMGDESATRSERLRIFGLSAAFNKPQVLNKCGAQEWKDGEWQKKLDCRSARDLKGLVDIEETPKARFEIPIPIGDCEEAEEGEPEPNPAEGPLCYKETTLIGPVPFTVEFSTELRAAVEYGATIDGDTMEPGFSVAPGIGIVMEVKGGVGATEEVGPLEFGAEAGIKAEITLVEIVFPIGWSLKVEELSKNGVVVPDMYSVKFVREVTAELSFFKLVLGLFFEIKAGISLFSPSWEYNFFEFEGIKLNFDISSDDLISKKVDFQWEPQ
jgi:hypothetical protein